MARLFEEIDAQDSPLGVISLRRRIIPAVGPDDIYEVKLGEEFLMSSLFVDAEVALAELGLKATQGEALDVVVGGLGLGYTARAALADTRIKELLVVEALPTVIRWHQNEQVPLGRELNADARCRYVLGSFFDLALDSQTGFDPEHPGRNFDAILLDIDHSPSDFLNADNADFYTSENLQTMSRQLKPGGIFAMWSQDPPELEFIALLGSAFSDVDSQVVSFYNVFQHREASNTIYIGRKPG